jgi:hypothetical protein
MIQPEGIIRALCMPGYASPTLYIRSLAAYRAGAVRNFRAHKRYHAYGGKG